MLRTDRNRGHQVGAKHSSFGQALENLLQGHGLSVSNSSAMTYTLPPLNALRAFEAAARHLSFKLAAHELHVTPATVGQQVKAPEAHLGCGLGSIAASCFTRENILTHRAPTARPHPPCGSDDVARAQIP